MLRRDMIRARLVLHDKFVLSHSLDGLRLLLRDFWCFYVELCHLDVLVHLVIDQE